MLDREPIPLFPAATPPAGTADAPVPDLRLLANPTEATRPTAPTAAPPPHGAGASPLLPIMAADDPLTPEVERRLALLAHAARAGDRAARDALYAALGPKIDAMLGRCRGLAWSSADPRRDGRPWELDDLAQESYLALVDLLAAWPGEGPVGPYLLAHLPWRIRTAWRRLAAPHRRHAPLLSARADLLVDGSAAAEEALVRLELVAAALPPPDGDLLLLRVRDGHPPAAIGRRLGLTRRTVDRRWRAVCDLLRSELGAAPSSPAPAPGAVAGGPTTRS